MNIVALIIQLVSGAVGGNIAGAILKKLNLGTLLNSIVGILGGGIGGQLLGMLHLGGPAPVDGGLNVASLVSSIAGGTVGGGVLMAIVGVIRKALSKSS